MVFLLVQPVGLRAIPVPVALWCLWRVRSIEKFRLLIGCIFCLLVTEVGYYHLLLRIVIFPIGYFSVGVRLVLGIVGARVMKPCECVLYV